MFEEEFVRLTPINFFQIGCDCFELPIKDWEDTILHERYLLPDMSMLCDESPFAKVKLGWSSQGIACAVEVPSPYNQPAYPALSSGDSVELFIDTRDVKTSGFNTRFCHHFFFLPDEVEGTTAGEITRFRTEDTHDLCDPKDLTVITEVRRKTTLLKMFIPAHCLVGYDPDQFDRLGFTYRINSKTHPSQHFSVLTQEYPIEQQPSLWASLRMKEEG
jgi:hypothetical protein